MKIKFAKLNENAKLPHRGSEEAGAFDVYASSITKEADDYYIVNLGFSTEIPIGYRMIISGRSGLTKTNWYIPNSPGLVDSDYRGEWQVRFRGIPINLSYTDSNKENFELKYQEFPFKVGDRVAQIYLEQVLDIDFSEVDNLNETTRGGGGFGSTGD